MDCFGYETFDKLIWTLGKGCRNKIQSADKFLQKAT